MRERDCALLAVIAVLTFAPAGVADGDYSWQKPQAKVLPQGDLKWAPEPFEFQPGDSVRYIDYENGDDDAPGTSKDSAWKHHPWDANAGGKAETCKGIHTYVFKRGVVYRGEMRAAESGEPGNPIRLTSDPAWGTGNARIYGSTQIRGGWKKATAADAPDIPDTRGLWYIDVGTDYDPDKEGYRFTDMWQVDGQEVTRLHIARTPNYELSDPNNPVKNWPVWQSREKNWLFSPVLKDLGDRNAVKRATIWTEASFLMAAATKTTIKDYDPKKGAVILNTRANMGRVNRKLTHFMIEDLPQLLDAPGEYYYQESGPNAGRLYLIPAGGKDPNQVVYEVAQIRIPIWVLDKSHIEVSGLEFRYSDPEDGDYAWPHQIYTTPSVRIVGNCTDVTVKNCSFYHVAGVVSAFTRPEDSGGPYGLWRKEVGDYANDEMDRIVISDNDAEHVSMGKAILVTGNFSSKDKEMESWGHLKDVKIMRNRIRNAGFRHGRHRNSPIPAIEMRSTEICEIAGNTVDRSYGSGIFTFGGKGAGPGEAPLIRTLVYNNQLDNTMLGCNDYGGLEHFQGGPIYIFNNLTRNAVGNRTLGKELAYNLYLDGGFKCYVYNNLIAGISKQDEPDYANHAGFFTVLGFMNHFFNNTIYRFQKGIDGSSGNRSNILGNLLADCRHAFIGQNRHGDVSMMGGGDTGESGRKGLSTLAYASNVFWGDPQDFGYVGGAKQPGQRKGPVYEGKTLEELRQRLEEQQCRDASLGWHVEENPLPAADKQDYRPRPGGPAADRGVKYFLPWSLYGVVGEWNFYRNPTIPDVVLGEGFYMTEEYMHRAMYYLIPRMDLQVAGATVDDYVEGPLEDWTSGALRFDGKSRFGVLRHEDMAQDMAYDVRGKKGKVPFKGSERKTVDMDTNNFLIEVVFRTEPGHTDGTLVSKEKENGYRLAIDEHGALRVILVHNGQTVCSRTSSREVNDGDWHHVIAEVDRQAKQGIRIYMDGNAADGAFSGSMSTVSLSNSADFLVGRAPDGRFFHGALDFLRVSRGTLKDAKTTIEELYEWQFNGPHLRDFAGQPPAGDRRDAGALEAKGVQ